MIRSAGAIDPASKTLLTEVDVPNPKGELLPGAYAEVLFHLKTGTPPLTIPSNTLIFRTSATQVAVVENGKAHLRTITIGRDLGNSLEVISGLDPGDSVIVNPPDSLADGAPVSVQQPDSAAACRGAGRGSLNMPISLEETLYPCSLQSSAGAFAAALLSALRLHPGRPQLSKSFRPHPACV